MHPVSAMHRRAARMRLHPQGSHLSSCRSLLLRPRVTRALSSSTSRRLAREHTRVAHCTYTVHVHARDARRAERGEQRRVLRAGRSELSRSHGSSSGSGGDIPTYLPIGPVALEPACRKRLSVSFSHPPFFFPPSFSFLRPPSASPTRPSSFTSADTPHSNPREGNRGAASVYTTRADRIRYRDNDKSRSKCENQFHLKSLSIPFTAR